jgi:hypothetical protein
MITIPIDPLNPGHVFAVVGLTELAHRITGSAMGSFDDASNFCLKVAGDVSIAELADQIRAMEITAEEPADKTTPLFIEGLRLDWWTTSKAEDTKAGKLKTWAGQQEIFSMARAAQASLSNTEQLLFDRREVYEPGSNKTKALPSLDAQRSASTLDTGYSPNELKHKIIPAPSVEFLAMVGLQRAFPAKIDGRHAYFTWSDPLPPILMSAALAGHISAKTGYVFGVGKDGDYSRIKSAQPIT